MAKAKVKKSLLKRFKITKNGKIMRRAMGQDHYLTKQTGKQRRNKRKWKTLPESEAKIIKKVLKYSR